MGLIIIIQIKNLFSIMLLIIMFIIYLLAMFSLIQAWYNAPRKEVARNELERMRKNQDNELRNLKFDKEIKFQNNVVCFDNTNNVLVIRDNSKFTNDIIKYTDILECEILENNNTVLQDGLGRALIGGVIAGGVGAVVGANTRKTEIITDLKIRIVTKNSSKSSYMIWLKSKEMSKQAFEFVNEVYAMIKNIISKNDITKNEIKNSNKGILEQFEDLQNLKNKGIITQEEFETKKKELLNKM